MNYPDFSQEEAEKLLQKYAPILHFAPGEKFYPMRIEDFVEKCQLKEYVKLRPDRLVQNEAKLDYISSDDNINSNLYLQFVHDSMVESRVWLSNVCTKISPKYGKQIANKLSRNFSALFWPLIYSIALVIFGLLVIYRVIDSNIANVEPLLLIGLAIVIYLIFLGLQFSGANRKTFLAIILNTIAILFIGSDFGITAGVMALFVTAGIFLIMGSRPRNPKQWLLLWSGFILLILFALLPLTLNYWPEYREGLFLKSHRIEWVLYCILFTLSIPFWSLIGKRTKNQTRFFLVMVFLMLIIFIMMVSALLGWGFLSNLMYGLSIGITYKFYEIIILRNGLILVSLCASTGLLWLYLDPTKHPDWNKNAGEKLCWSSDWNKGVTFLAGIAIAIWLIACYIFQLSDPISKFLLILVVILLNLFFADLLLRGKDIALILSLVSGQSNSVAERATINYTAIQENSTEKWCYYGRVLSEPNDNMITLQYHYFYAYNDWRRAANGINHHEGDWEAVVIYLRDDSLYGVAYSTHNHGKFLFKEDLKNNHLLVDDTHPKVFVALGSHANYPDIGDEGIHPMGEQLSGTVEKVFIGYDRLITQLHDWFEKLEYSTQKEDTRIICPTIQLMAAEWVWEQIRDDNQKIRKQLHQSNNLQNNADQSTQKKNKLIENITKQGIIRQRLMSIKERLIEEISYLSAKEVNISNQQDPHIESKETSTQPMSLYKEFGMWMETQPITIEAPDDECQNKLDHLHIIGEDLKKEEELHPMIAKARDHFNGTKNNPAYPFLNNKSVGQRIVDLANGNKPSDDGIRISHKDIKEYQEKPKLSRTGLFNDVTQNNDSGLIIGVLDNKQKDLLQFDWSCKVLIENEEPPWIKFKGLWGKATLFAGESGPTGPKWTHYTKYGKQIERDRWQTEDWKDKLLFEILQDNDEKVATRKKALNALTTDRNQNNPK